MWTIASTAGSVVLDFFTFGCVLFYELCCETILVDFDSKCYSRFCSLNRLLEINVLYSLVSPNTAHLLFWSSIIYVQCVLCVCLNLIRIRA